MQGVTALGTGAIEWFSAAVTLGFALYAVRRAPRFHEQARTA
jgi:O-antigen/teichoic acid export membrane protein